MASNRALGRPSSASAVAGGGGGAICHSVAVLAHLLEESARHAGHADILRELTDGQTGR